MEDKNPQSTQQYWDPTQTNVAEADLEREVRVMRQKTKMRHRLIGGGVLLSTLLITLPMLFSEPSVQTNQQAKTKVPGIPSEPFGRLEFSVNSAIHLANRQLKYHYKTFHNPILLMIGNSQY